MSNIIKTIIFSCIALLGFVTEEAFADHRPEFEIINPLVFENEIIELRGDFEPQGTEFITTEQPLTWFEIGTDPGNLDFETPRRPQSQFSSRVITQGITQLQPNTVYYVRTAIKFDGDTEKSDPVSFNTGELTPVSINGPVNPTTTISDDITLAPSGSINASDSIPSVNQNIDIFRPDLSFIAPSRFLPRSSEEKSIQEREEILEIRERALLEAQENQRLARTGQPRSDFDNSASNDDERGEIIISGSSDNGNNSSGIGTASVINAGQSGNSNVDFGGLLLFVSLLVGAVMLTQATFSSKRNYSRYPNTMARSRVPAYATPPPAFPQKRSPQVRPKYQNMRNNPAAYTRFAHSR